MIERDEILDKYLDSPGIPPSGYQPALEGNLLENFLKQISMSAYTWRSLILGQYFEKLPEAVNKSRNILQLLEKEKE